jgi:fructosamine-3-kinase
MDLPEALRARVAAHLNDPITTCASVGGGCIANGCRLETEGRALFLKYGDDEVARTFPGEAAGLEALAEAGVEAVVIPEVVVHEPPPGDGAPGFLLMEWINAGRQHRGFWPRFGEGLAAVHRHTADRFGFGLDNYIGRLPQSNTWTGHWPDFFRRERLMPQAEMARAAGVWLDAWDAPFDTLCRRLDDLLPEVPAPSLVHGDLWSGNFMVTATGQPCLIDPATYYGHREADVAMTELFGGFDDRFYAAYRAAWPLAPGYDERRDVYNLYHLMNHANHFGGRYVGDVDAALQRYA